MTDWKNALNFGEPTATESNVNGKSVNFYPVSVGVMFKLRRMAKPLAGAISVLTNGAGKDTGHIYREVGGPAVDDNGKPILVGEGDSTRTVRDNESITEAITPQLAELRSKQKADAVETLISCMSDEKNLELVVEIVLDSTRMSRSMRPPAQEFMSQTSLPVLTELILGVCKANKDVFGPLSSKLAPLFTQIQGAVEEKVSEVSENLSLVGNE